MVAQASEVAEKLLTHPENAGGTVCTTTADQQPTSQVGQAVSPASVFFRKLQPAVCGES
jgi:hypothetical protein